MRERSDDIRPYTANRIKAERAKRRLEEVREKHRAEERALNREYERFWLAYVRECEAAGVCAFCGTRLDACKCVFLAAETEDVSGSAEF